MKIRGKIYVRVRAGVDVKVNNRVKIQVKIKVRIEVKIGNRVKVQVKIRIKFKVNNRVYNKQKWNISGEIEFGLGIGFG